MSPSALMPALEWKARDRSNGTPLPRPFGFTLEPPHMLFTHAARQPYSRWYSVSQSKLPMPMPPQRRLYRAPSSYAGRPEMPPPRSILPIPPPKRTASAVTTVFSLNVHPLGTPLSSSTQPLRPLRNSNVPRYTQVPPAMVWLTANFVSPPAWCTVYDAQVVLLESVL